MKRLRLTPKTSDLCQLLTSRHCNRNHGGFQLPPVPERRRAYRCLCFRSRTHVCPTRFFPNE